MPIYEYVAEYCVKSLYCPKRFAFRQGMSDPPIQICPTCGTQLKRILSPFSAGIDMCANAEAWAKTDAGSDAPPATLKNMFGGGLGDLGCGHHHPDGLAVVESCDHHCNAVRGSGGRKR